jgi:hypothetical protein
MFPWNPFQERLFSLRKCLLYSPSKGHIFRTGSWWVSWVGGQGRKRTWSSAATRIVLAKDARRAVAVDTVTAELSWYIQSWIVRPRESGETQLYLVVKCNKSDCQSNTRLSHLTRDNVLSLEVLTCVTVISKSLSV